MGDSIDIYETDLSYDEDSGTYTDWDTGNVYDAHGDYEYNIQED